MEPILKDPNSFFEGHFALPPLPAVVNRLIEVLESGRANAAEVSEILSSDPGLVAQLLKIVNSAYYGLPRPIRDVRHAVAYLGLAEIRRVALTVGIMAQLRPDDAEGFERFWYHSFHTALAAKYIARKTAKVVDPEEIHVAALLHDVGKLVYLKFFPDHFEKIGRYRQEHKALWTDAERHFEFPPHALLGASLCDRWLLPDSVKSACKSHELPDLEKMLASDNRHDELVVVAVANLLSNLCTEELADTTRSSIQEQSCRALAIDSDEFLLLMGELLELRSEVQRFLSDL